jgi:hypothetical protein
MEGLQEFLRAVHQHGLVAGHLRGLFHIAIGRRVTRADGTPVSAGVTWRELANLLKDLKYEKELVAEVGGNPEELSPRDRLRFWYSAIALARPDSAEARAQAETLAAAVKPFGYVIGPPPGPPAAKAASPKPPAPEPATPKPEEPAAKPKKKKK